MKNTIEVNYKIEPVNENNSYWDKNKIISNIANDETVDWKISKSLSDELISKSASLKAEQLLIQMAEMQKRELEYTVESLNDIELTIKTKSELIESTLKSALDKQEQVYNDKRADLESALNQFKMNVEIETKKVENILKPVNDCVEVMKKIDSYSLRSFIDTVEKLDSLVNKSPKLVEIISNNIDKL